MSDLISRLAAMSIPLTPKEHRNYQTFNLDDAYDEGWGDYQACIALIPPAQPERLTDDDFETIRIHLNACKEKLCNQNRLEEAKEYQRIIDRFMAFASAQPVITCDGCRFVSTYDTDFPCCNCVRREKDYYEPER